MKSVLSNIKYDRLISLEAVLRNWKDSFCSSKVFNTLYSRYESSAQLNSSSIFLRQRPSIGVLQCSHFHLQLY